MTKVVDEYLRPTEEQIRAVNEQWVEQAAVLATHALTLTFDGGKIDGYIKKCSSIHTANDPKMVERYLRSMARFRALLDKRLYGHLSERKGAQMLFIPVIEGLGPGQNPHYHCLLGVSANRFDKVEAAVRDCWEKVPFAGKRIEIAKTYDQGFSGYSTKNARSLDKESVDWMSISLPSWSRSTAG